MFNVLFHRFHSFIVFLRPFFFSHSGRSLLCVDMHVECCRFPPHWTSFGDASTFLLSADEWNGGGDNGGWAENSTGESSKPLVAFALLFFWICARVNFHFFLSSLTLSFAAKLSHVSLLTSLLINLGIMLHSIHFHLSPLSVGNIVFSVCRCFVL